MAQEKITMHGLAFKVAGADGLTEVRTVHIGELSGNSIQITLSCPCQIDAEELA